MKLSLVLSPQSLGMWHVSPIILITLRAQITSNQALEEMARKLLLQQSLSISLYIPPLQV